jgi:calreticulin
MRAATLAILYVAFMAVASAEVYFKETFDKNWESRWVKSKNKEADGTAGTWELSHGKYYRDAQEDLGLKTAQDARFYQISAEIPKEFSNKGKDLVVQYSVKHEQKIDCGGGYLKLIPTGLDQSNFNGDSSYYLMFGPDICGSSTKKTHLIFGYKGKNHLIKKDIKCETDEFTHLYTLIIHPDNTYEVLIDEKSVAKGSIKEDFDMLPPKEIKDPNSKKPSDWVDEKTIADPSDHKPEGWDSIPKEIVDPDASKPEDWDDELDGEWEAPMIDNPEYKGEWKAKTIPNPAYKGEWVHPMIANPDYVEDDNLYAFDAVKYVGIEIWQVKAGTIFDNIIVTDSTDEATKLAEVTKKLQEAEKEQSKKDEEERQQKEEEERKAREAEEAEMMEEEEEAEEEEHGGKDEL